MAFQRLRKSDRRIGDAPATITIGTTTTKTSASRQAFLSWTGRAMELLGEPAAFVLDFDPEAYQLRLSAAPVDDPDALRVGKTSRVGITSIARQIGFMWDIPVTVEVTPAGRSAVIADFSEVRTGRTSARRAA